MGEYLEEFDFLPLVAENEKRDFPAFIPENIFYKLCFKASNETARAFQDLVTDEILPTIRKTGRYEAKPKDRTPDRLKIQALNAQTRHGYLKLKQAEFITQNADKLKHSLTPAMYDTLILKALEDISGQLLPRPQLEEKLIDATGIAESLGILSESGNPHAQAVTVIIAKLDIPAEDVFTTAFERNGHQGGTTQYKMNVLEKVRAWLEANNWPAPIEGAGKRYKVVYRKAA